MKRWWMVAALALALSTFGVAQSDQQSAADRDAASRAQAPAGTQPVQTEQQTVVRPQTKPIKVTPAVISSAQKALADRGYEPGPVDGVIGPRTRAALSKFQSDQGITQTGSLDANTMEKLNVGGAQSVASAPADIGRGGKAFGHDIKGGHPIAASKALGQGAESAGKKVGKGAKSVAVGAADKVGKGLSAIGHKISDKTEGKKDKDDTTPHNPQL